MSQNESPVERIKKNSHGLRGTLKESLKDEHTGAIREDDQSLIKFHGMYMQDDRDRREERAAKKLERLYSFMIRLRLPGGLLKPNEWVGLHHIAGEHTTGVIKITTRQTVQLHGILKSHIKPTIKAFDQMRLDSIAACGDVNRNVTCSAHPSYSPIFQEIFEYADKISYELLPKTRAYYEVWLDEEKLAEVNEEDPLYQDRYLPRKFKIAVAVPPYNDVDIFTNDAGLIAVVEKGKLTGFNVTAGGGLGTTHGNPDTYPRLADVLGYVSKEDAIKALYAIATVQRDYGNRSDRKLSRLKYTIDKMGLPAFKAEVEKRLGFDFETPRKADLKFRHDEYGWHKNHQGLWYYTAFVESGRVLDTEEVQLKQAFLEIAQAEKANFRFTCNQNLIVADIKEEDKAFVENILSTYGVIANTEKASPVRRNALACVAFNTCPLALAEAQRYLPSLITKVEELMGKHKIQQEGISIRMTGCPNGCARPYISEIGFVGTNYGRYNLHLGSDVIGTRLNKFYKENLDEEQILAELDGLFGRYSSGRKKKESFGDFVVREGIV
ncbi:NADPH-dependent assimilatory sulfite reductase hemoprotein subunit [Foetidibacter luteolus]|uniref:NADPH-dependent assimilatory sulfite reductase hemoprotein subunit n=1 Tax=Foetidibacter luteolus TaxID=2608880 RepID=UPI00129A3FDE|nr:NADPH-dependent assimilatory sulfite reductase hemoprotein subunit [Foetidibacter luteolus]